MIPVKRRIQLPHQLAGFVAVTANDDPVRLHEIIDCRTFLEKFGRITSYNVCYTKLLRLDYLFKGGMANVRLLKWKLCE